MLSFAENGRHDFPREIQKFCYEENKWNAQFKQTERKKLK